MGWEHNGGFHIGFFIRRYSCNIFLASNPMAPSNDIKVLTKGLLFSFSSQIVGWSGCWSSATNKGGSKVMDSFLFYHCFLKPGRWTLHPWPLTPGWPSHKLITVGLIKASCKTPTVVQSRGSLRSLPSVLPFPDTKHFVDLGQGIPCDFGHRDFPLLTWTFTQISA